MQAEALKKLSPAAITKVVGRQIIDSRGNPTVQVGTCWDRIKEKQSLGKK